MPRVIETGAAGALPLAECLDRLAARGFDPADEASLAQAASDLAALGADRGFLGDCVLDRLKAGFRELSEDSGGYGPQVIMLGRAGSSGFVRANIWPSHHEAALRASGAAAFSYDLPHDHNFSFLTHGYFGPGYWSDGYTYDYAAVAGWRGEPVDLAFTGRYRLEPGQVMLYRAHRDVHRQLPPDALSVSLNLMHFAADHVWHDQYRFEFDDDGTARVGGVTNPGAGEVILRMAVALEAEVGPGNACDLAERFARAHPSDRMRLAAWEALALASPDAGARDALWARAEAAGSAMVSIEAKARRTALIGD